MGERERKREGERERKRVRGGPFSMNHPSVKKFEQKVGRGN